MPTTPSPDVLLHACGVEYTLTPNGIYVMAPEQRVQARPFQPWGEWPLLPALRAFWPWPILRQIWTLEDKAVRAERRRSAAKRRGIVVLEAGKPAAPIVVRFPRSADPVMLAWRQRVRERALAEEPIRVEYGLDQLTGAEYCVRLIGAWTRLPRTDLQPAAERALVRDSLAAAQAAAEAISSRLRRAGRQLVVLEAEAV
jgi:hypothetical protein